MLFFSAPEIVEIAIQIERNGLAFYQCVAGSLEHEETKTLFGFLSKQEEKHIKDFQSLFESFKKYQPPITNEEEYCAYIKMLADMNVFTKKEGIAPVLEKVKNKEDALDVAMAFEKDSILFYRELDELTQGSQKAAVEEIIRQEKEHLRRLFCMGIGR